MFAVLRNRTYRHLFGAHVVALTGTGLATVALGLLAYDIAGADAGAVLGTALAVKMVAYVGVAPIAAALLGALPRRAVLVALDVVRAGAAVALPWVDQVWQVYVLMFVLQAASAAFTPIFQATVPDVLPDEREYTRAITLSRMAYDLEGLLSPALAAALLVLVSFDDLFLGTAIGFAGSALLVVSAVVPRPDPVVRTGSRYAATTRGIRIYLATPRLRGLLAVHLATAAAGSMVLVNTVAYVREVLDRSASDVAIALACNGVGSLAAAVALPRLLDRFCDRDVVLRAVAVLLAALLAGATFAALLGDWHWPAVLVLWAVIGAGCSLASTPGARLLRRSAHAEHRPALFAADFALSHACWLLCYPLAGWVASAATTTTAFLVLGVVTAGGALTALRLWPRHDPAVVEHEHCDLDAGHDHLHDAVLAGGVYRHAHEFRIDDHHERWPRQA
ncbi:Predicted arabinose efflux permease, MFS family [Lentzea xinjiangensis]|uniref:Predicted arabinose efflux permease, MFS family n=1 Tax=Lentzea xinjiangensis TaxID=402600 RepID=A0A1H9UBG5_9PSEU|nr:MFS transporter [Lentzea xinjiangensis]SES06682.1 Predicted arabinose efflux permease, MFS family [Lentzea xinjiangensis]